MEQTIIPDIASDLDVDLSAIDKDVLRGVLCGICLWIARKALENDNPKIVESINNKFLSTFGSDEVRRDEFKDPPIHFRDDATYGVPISYVKFLLPEKIVRERKRSVIERETAIQMKVRKLREENSCGRKRLPIRKLWIGPLQQQKEARSACEILLSEKGYDDVDIRISDIPYWGSLGMVNKKFFL